MKLLFSGHDQRYAVEQSLLAFFPNERPVYDTDAPDANTARVRLAVGKCWATATTEIAYDGKAGKGTGRSQEGNGFHRTLQTGSRALCAPG